MQNYNCANISVGTTATLYDSRDKQAYTVYRWANSGTNGTDYPSSMPGSCLMTSDLNLGYDTATSLTLTTDTSAGAGTINYVNSTNGGTGWSTTNSNSNLQYTYGPKSGSEAYSSHSYYSYGAAQKVCPKGWRLPTSTEYNNIAAFMGGSNSTGSTNIRNTPYNFIYGGLFYSGGWNTVGSHGHYWLSLGNVLLFSPSELFVGSDNKSYGMSVRCVAQ